MTKITRIAALAALFTAACAGEAGPAGSSGADGAVGADGRGGQPCTVTQNADGGATVTCPDGSTVTIAAPGGCTIRDNGDGTRTVSCADGTGAVISDGSDGVDATRTPGTVSGTVVDPVGRPLAGVTARLLNTPFSTVSGANGTFRLTEVSAGVHELELSHPSYGAQSGGMVVVDTTETRLGTLTLRAGAFLAPGFYSQLSNISSDGRRALADRAFFGGRGGEQRRAVVVDLPTASVVGGWPHDPSALAEWVDAELRGVVYATWLEQNLSLCDLRFRAADSDVEAYLGQFACDDVTQPRGVRLSLRRNDWSGVRGEYVEIDLATGVVAGTGDFRFFGAAPTGDLYRSVVTDELVLRPLDGSPEMNLNFSASAYRGWWSARAEDPFFWIAWFDVNAGTQVVGRLDTASRLVTIAIPSFVDDFWGGPAIFPVDGGLYYYANRVSGPNGESGDLRWVTGETEPTTFCQSNAFGDFRLHAGSTVLTCLQLSQVPGEGVTQIARRRSDGAGIATILPGTTMDFGSIDADWIARYDWAQTPSTLEVISVADGSVVTLSTTMNNLAFGGNNGYVWVSELLPDGTPELAVYRLSDQRRTALPIGVSLFWADLARDAVFAWAPDGFVGYDLSTGALAWSRPLSGYWTSFSEAGGDAWGIATPSRLHPELWTLTSLDVVDGHELVLADGAGLFVTTADQRTLVWAEGPFPSVDTGRAPGLYALPLP